MTRSRKGIYPKRDQRGSLIDLIHRTQRTINSLEDALVLMKSINQKAYWNASDLNRVQDIVDMMKWGGRK